MNHRSCPECGARVDASAERCDLCGASLDVASGAGAAEGGAAGREQTPRSREGVSAPAEAEPGERDSAEAVYCNDCGAANPPGSNFCSRCGVRLRSGTSGAGVPDVGAGVPAAGAAAESGPTSASQPGRSVTSTRAVAGGAPELSRSAGSTARPNDSPASAAPAANNGGTRGLTRHVAAVIGLSVLLVVALYMITVISKQPGSQRTESVAAAPVEARAASVIQEHEAIPVSETYRGRVDSLQSVIEAAETAQSVGTRRQLVDFLIGIGRIDRAAIEQQRVARITEEAADWKMAGNLLFDWMEMSESDTKPDVALLTIDAYKELLERQPDDLDARADLGWAYQYDPRNPMEAIRQTNLVLEEKPNHLGANYNRGVFLLRINRLDDAVEQFERVKSIAGADSPYYRQAEMWIDTIEESRREDGAGES